MIVYDCLPCIVDLTTSDVRCVYEAASLPRWHGGRLLTASERFYSRTRIIDVCFVQLMCPQRKFIGPTTSDRGEEIYNVLRWHHRRPVMARRIFSCGEKWRIIADRMMS